MTDVAIRNPNLHLTAKRRVEEVAVDEETKSPKQAKRPKEEPDAGTKNMSPVGKEVKIWCSGFAEWRAAASTRKKESPSVKEGSSDEDNDSDAEEDYDPEDDDWDGPPGEIGACCSECVDDEICKVCGCKNGFPPVDIV